MTEDRDVEVTHETTSFVAELRRLADALDSRAAVTIPVDGKDVTIPEGARPEFAATDASLDLLLHDRHPAGHLAAPAHSPYVHGVPGSLGTMAINAPIINGSDPGAVPGDSTIPPGIAGVRGRNRIDGRLKGPAFAR